MFLKGSKSSKDAKGLLAIAGVNVAGLAMAGAEENEDIPNGSLLVKAEPDTGAMNGLLLFSGTGGELFIMFSRGGKAGGAAKIGVVTGGGATLGVAGCDDDDSAALGSNSSSCKSSSVKLSRVMPPKSTCEDVVDSSKQMSSLADLMLFVLIDDVSD